MKPEGSLVVVSEEILLRDRPLKVPFIRPVLSPPVPSPSSPQSQPKFIWQPSLPAPCCHTSDSPGISRRNIPIGTSTASWSAAPGIHPADGLRAHSKGHDGSRIRWDPVFR